MFLKGIEFETIWRVAHKWVDQDPNANNIGSLQDLVKIRIQRLARAVIKRKLSLRKSNGVPALDSGFIFSITFEGKIFWPLRNCYVKEKFDQSLLDSVYVSRAEVLKWCEGEYLSPPQFWLENNLTSNSPEKSKDSPASKRDKAEAAWKAFAQALWMIDQRIHPRHIAESKAFRKFENVKDYKPDTVRDWIADLDPSKIDRNGRPNDIEYYIDLETGGLNEKGITTFIKK